MSEKYIPCGIVDDDSGQLHTCFGSSYKTSDFIVDTLKEWWNGLPTGEQKKTQLLQLKVDNGPESCLIGRRRRRRQNLRFASFSSA
jgi:hypothetical protein